MLTTTFAFHTGDGLDIATISWLAELGFVQNKYFARHYQCQEPEWTIILKPHHGAGAVDHLDGQQNNVEVKLRRNDFPVDRILRMKRLRALLA